MLFGQSIADEDARPGQIPRLLGECVFTFYPSALCKDFGSFFFSLLDSPVSLQGDVRIIVVLAERGHFVLILS